jgi:hypothetical protein
MARRFPINRGSVIAFFIPTYVSRQARDFGGQAGRLLLCFQSNRKRFLDHYTSFSLLHDAVKELRPLVSGSESRKHRNRPKAIQDTGGLLTAEVF